MSETKISRPVTDQPRDLLKRIAWALQCVKDGKPDLDALAKVLGVHPSHVSELWRGGRSRLAPVDYDVVWYKIVSLVGVRMGLLLSVREELNRKLALDRRARAARRARIANR